MNKLTCFCILLFAAVGTAIPLPSDFKQCKRADSDFNVCLTVAIQDAIVQLTAGSEALGLGPLDPLTVSADLVPGGGAEVLLALQNFQNISIRGFGNPNVSKAELDFDDLFLDVVLAVPELRLEFAYDFQGLLVLVPVQGKGRGNITFGGVTFNVTFQLDQYDNAGEIFLKVIETKLKFDIQVFNALFGDLARSATESTGLGGLGGGLVGTATSVVDLNVLLNTNWQAVFAPVKPIYESFFAAIFQFNFNAVLSRVPFAQLFGAAPAGVPGGLPTP